MRRVTISLLIGFTWLLVSMFLRYLRVRYGNGPSIWLSDSLFWPGALIAIEIAVFRTTGQFFGEGWSDILVVVLANFWVAALSNLVFYSGLAYILLSVFAKAKRRAEGQRS
jgi:hypothetical protein